MSLAHEFLDSTDAILQGEIMLGTEQRQQVDQKHPWNFKHDRPSLVANARQSIISSPDGVSATHNLDTELRPMHSTEDCRN